MGLFEVTGIWMLAIGKTIVHSIWIGLVIMALLRLALAFIPVKLSRLRYGISVSALFILFFSVIAVFLALYEPESARLYLLSFQELISLGSRDEYVSSTGVAAFNTGLLFTLFGYIYLVGVLFMVFRSVTSMAHLRKVKKAGRQPHPDWQLRFLNLCNSLGIKRSVDLLESDQLHRPLLLAYLKPAIIVPVGMLTNLPAGQVETIILHELYHLKRRDFLVNFMQLFIEGLLFYHPVVWFISDKIRSEREHCCDDKVLSNTDNPLNYAKALIHLAEQQQFSRLAPGAVGSEKHQFYARIKRILNYKSMKTNMRDKVLAISLLAVSLILLVTVSGFNAAPSFTGNANLIAENIAVPDKLPGIVIPDTIPEKNEQTEIEDLEEIEEPDWEAIEEEIEEARLEALKEIEEIDWESIKEEIEEARLEALEEIEEIDWESIKEEMEEARLEALEEIEEIDWESIKEEMEEARLEALEEIEEIDWESIKEEMEEARLEALEEIEEIDWESIKEQIREDMEEARIYHDSIKNEMDL